MEDKYFETPWYPVPNYKDKGASAEIRDSHGEIVATFEDIKVAQAVCHVMNNSTHKHNATHVINLTNK